jgi:hypothetical protein
MGAEGTHHIGVIIYAGDASRPAAKCKPSVNQWLEAVLGPTVKIVLGAAKPAFEKVSALRRKMGKTPYIDVAPTMISWTLLIWTSRAHRQIPSHSRLGSQMAPGDLKRKYRREAFLWSSAEGASLTPSRSLLGSTGSAGPRIAMTAITTSVGLANRGDAVDTLLVSRATSSMLTWLFSIQ